MLHYSGPYIEAPVLKTCGLGLVIHGITNINGSSVLTGVQPQTSTLPALQHRRIHGLFPFYSIGMESQDWTLHLTVDRTGSSDGGPQR